ncbi:MAG: zinc-ribbon domain-containing protein, partial [Ruminococcus sp.]|nr:zinc-ribbon domain-containing protein [Ruminococcus sp.]
MKIICKQCHREFEITDSEIRYFRSKNLNIPKRCRNCRKINRKINNPDNYQYDSTEAKIINYKTIIIILCLIIIAILIVSITAVTVLSPADNSGNSESHNLSVVTHTQQTESAIHTEPITHTTTQTEQVTHKKYTKSLNTKTEQVTHKKYTKSLNTKTEQVTTTQQIIQTAQAEVITYYLNTYRKKFHKPDCDS